MLSGADLARMERYEADGTVTGVAAWSLAPVRLAVGTRFPLDGSSIARDVRRTVGPVRLDSFSGATGAIAEEAHAVGIRSSVGCPITVAGQLWGVIAASTRRDEPFPADTESQIARFTELVATAVESAEAREELRRIAEEQAALRRVATLVAHGDGAGPPCSPRWRRRSARCYTRTPPRSSGSNRTEKPRSSVAADGRFNARRERGSNRFPASPRLGP